MYHRIGHPPSESRWSQLFVHRKDLIRQLDKLQRRGYTPLTQRDLYDGWNGRRILPDKPVVFTFDDGNVSVWEQAFPLFRAKRWPAVVNLPVSALDSSLGLSTDMVRELLAAGWELGAHSRTHPDLTKVDAQRLQSEIVGSRSDLTERFQVPVDFFCYPFGRFSRKVMEAVERAGYLGATTVNPGVAGPEQLYAMPRVPVNRGDSGRAVVKRMKILGQAHERFERVELRT